MSEITRILCDVRQGNPLAAGQLLPLVYDELRKLAAHRMAAERPDHTLEATALVHEAYVRLVDADHDGHWSSRRHFFGAAAEAMRRILVENARSKGRLKRGGGGEWKRVELSGVEPEAAALGDDVLALLARAHDPARGALDPLGVGHRGPAELHDHGAGHGLAV